MTADRERIRGSIRAHLHGPSLPPLFRPLSAHPSISLRSHRSIFSYHSISGVTTGLEPKGSKVLSYVVSRPEVPAAFTKAVYPGVPSQDLEPLKLWAQQLPVLSLEEVHIKMSDVTLVRKSWMYHCDKMLRCVHPTMRAVPFLFPADIVQQLCQLSTRKLSATPLEFDTWVVLTRRIFNKVGLQILVSLMWQRGRDSLRPCVSGLGW